MKNNAPIICTVFALAIGNSIFDLGLLPNIILGVVGGLLGGILQQFLPEPKKDKPSILSKLFKDISEVEGKKKDQ
jgi:uncharacterized membrane protein YeaQ/YmgE (transglycosylase-associated protein family)